MKKILIIAALLIVGIAVVYAQVGQTLRVHYTTMTATAGAITLSEGANFYAVAGTASVTSITARPSGTVVWLMTTSTDTLVDGSNLKLAGDFPGTANDVIQLVCDGTNWHEVSRSAN